MQIFPQTQSYIEGYSQPYRLDQDQNEGGSMLFNTGGVPPKLLKATFNSKDTHYKN